MPGAKQWGRGISDGDGMMHFITSSWYSVQGIHINFPCNRISCIPTSEYHSLCRIEQNGVSFSMDAVPVLPIFLTFIVSALQLEGVRSWKSGSIGIVPNESWCKCTNSGVSWAYVDIKGVRVIWEQAKSVAARQPETHGVRFYLQGSGWLSFRGPFRGLFACAPGINAVLCGFCVKGARIEIKM